MEKSKLRERVATAVLMKLLNKIDPWEVGVVDMVHAISGEITFFRLEMINDFRQFMKNSRQ